MTEYTVLPEIEDLHEKEDLLAGCFFEETRQDCWLSCSTCGNMGLDEVEQLDYNVSASRIRFRCPGCNQIQDSPLFE